jgi:hypothetical protein
MKRKTRFREDDLIDPELRRKVAQGKRAELTMIAKFRAALAPFTEDVVSYETREFIRSQVERIRGWSLDRYALDGVTHVLASEERAKQVTVLWGITVIGSPEVKDDGLVILAAYHRLEPVREDGEVRVCIKFIPLATLMVRWNRDPRTGANIEGVECVDKHAAGW